MSAASSPPAAADLRQRLAAEQRERAAACGKELEALLAKHECRLEATFTVSARGVVPRITIVPQ